MSRTASRIQVQYGALPWRRTSDGVEILLITTRNTRRWIVPKGWPDKALDAHECAAHEAYEEAGVIGDIAGGDLGAFTHRKQLKSGQMITCRIHVFALEVTDACTDWTEKDQRDTRWCSVAEALKLVGDSGLRRIIEKFSRAITAIDQAA